MKAALLAGLALTTLPIAEDTPSFAVEEGDTLSCAWSISTTRETIVSTFLIAGEEYDVGSDSTFVRHLTLALSDEIGSAAEDGSPLEIVRSYEEVDLTFGEDGETEGPESELASETVIFTYDPEDEEWSAAFGEDSGGEDEWLDELSPRVDLARLLEGVDGDLEKGATWEVPMEFLGDVLRPGGAVVPIEREEPKEIKENTVTIYIPSAASIHREDEFEGEMTATFEEVVEEDDVKLAKIVVEVSVSTELDMIEDLEELAEERGATESYGEAALIRELDGTLTIYWNLAEHRAASISGELTGSNEINAAWTSANQAIEIEVTFHGESDDTHEIEASFDD